MAHTRSRLTSWVVAGIVLAAIATWQWQHGEAIAATSPDGDARVIALLVRAHRRVAADARLARVDMTAVCGNGVLDLRGVQLEPGGSVVVDILNVAGSVTIRVPDGWVVDTMTLPVLAAWHDERRPSAVVHQTPGWLAPRLVLRGAVIAGRLTVKS
jgi:hypothetical protein